MKDEKLIYAYTEKSADMLYFAKMNIPDPFFAFTHNGSKCALLSPLEIGRAKKQSAFDVIYPASRRGDVQDIVVIFSDLGIESAQIPHDFPVSVYKKLKGLGLKLDICEGDFFPARRYKTKEEITEIRKANAAACAAYDRVIQILRESKAEGGFLKWRAAFVTSELLKYEIEAACLFNGANSKNTIAAAGDQACDPHCEGYGKIRQNELIIVDIFPRMQSSGYFGDMTRTFIKGRPNEAQTKIVETVKNAQELALSKISQGVMANTVHEAVSDFFENNKFETKFENDAWKGFFHSTGHGIGLEVHEEPRIGLAKNRLQKGEVVTIEPGLYYPGVGACRIEDNVLVLEDGAQMLSDYPYDWVID